MTKNQSISIIEILDVQLDRQKVVIEQLMKRRRMLTVSIRMSKEHLIYLNELIKIEMDKYSALELEFEQENNDLIFNEIKANNHD